MKKFKHQCLAMCACIVAVSPSFACRPGDLESEFQLEAGESALTSEQIQNLTHWYSIWKTGSNAKLGVTEVSISARATENNVTSLRLAKERIANFKRLIEIGDPDHAPFFESVNQLSADSPAYPHIIDKVVLAIQPECTKTQTCCP